MTFDDVTSDIVKLVGLTLESVRPGAEIRILSVDLKQGNLQLRTAAGLVRSRPLYELERIWNELQRSPAVHVDQVLNGSGTSRNQPETILANLPYIEWAKIHNKKHLVYVGESTHAYGTLKKMDATAAAKVSAQIDDSIGKTDITLVVVTTDIKNCIDFFQGSCGGVVTTKEQGVYLLETNTCQIAFITPSQSGLEIGQYPVIEATKSVYRVNAVEILGEELIPIYSGNIRLLIRQK